jgi:hypothetical protein
VVRHRPFWGWSVAAWVGQSLRVLGRAARFGQVSLDPAIVPAVTELQPLPAAVACWW